MVARTARCVYQVIKISLPWKGSSLLDKKLAVPLSNLKSQISNVSLSNLKSQISNVSLSNLQSPISNLIPNTYVPARNTIFLSFALSFAEAINAEAVVIGANALDYSGYPDCRPAYFQAAQKLFNLATKAGVEGKKIKVLTPLLHKTKAEIIKLGTKLKVPYRLTWSCYRGGARPCGTCDSCLLRAKGFREAKVPDLSL
jgi:7-cyano-7-deazaguanine synthase